MTLPVRPVVVPAALVGQTNGKVDPDVMVSVTHNGSVATLVRVASQAFTALVNAAAKDGHLLVPYSTYRSYERQAALFQTRYTKVPRAGTDVKVWNGTTYYKRPNVPTTAAPGTSNHGWGLAVDLRVRRPGEKPIDDAAVSWLVQNEVRFGWSHEIQSEPWHIRYWAGDDPPITQPIPEDDMPLTEDDLDKIGARVQAELRKGTGNAQPDWPSTNKAILGTIQTVSNVVNRLAAQPPGSVNVAALAAEMVDLMDDDLAAAVSHELERKGFVVVKVPEE